MQTITAIVLAGLFIFGLVLVSNSDSVKQSEYQHCKVTSTDKALCEQIIK